LIRVVVDTNVFVSGVFWKGPPHQVLRAWSAGQFKMIATVAILDEYERVLNELAGKYGFENPRRILELLRLNVEMVTPIRFARPVCRDRDDDKFLAAALAGNAPILVSGDKDLHAVDGFKGIRVLLPKAFISEYRL
jgi:putative PIN family toxin of toxin-antitoxin system